MTKTTDVNAAVNKDDDRNKNCTICDAAFRDNTRPRNKVTCSPKCQRKAKTAGQRKVYREENPYKPNQREKYYHSELEYPYWATTEKITHNQFWKTDVPYSPDTVQGLITSAEKKDYMGGTKKATSFTPYNGDTDESYKVYVNIVPHAREQRPVTVTKMSREDMDAYFSKEYSR